MGTHIKKGTASPSANRFRPARHTSKDRPDQPVYVHRVMNISPKMVALMALGAMCLPAHGQRLDLGDPELRIAGVAIGDQARAVIARLGKPNSIAMIDDGLEYRYAGLTILLATASGDVADSDAEVADVTSTNPHACTPSGICPGMMDTDLHSRFGVPKRVERNGGTMHEYAWPTEKACWLQLRIDDRVVRSVRIACQP